MKNIKYKIKIVYTTTALTHTKLKFYKSLPCRYGSFNTY